MLKKIDEIVTKIMATPDPKFAKLSCEGKLEVKASLAVSANAFNTLAGTKKVTKLASYLEGDAFNSLAQTFYLFL